MFTMTHLRFFVRLARLLVLSLKPNCKPYARCLGFSKLLRRPSEFGAKAIMATQRQQSKDW